MLCYISRPLFIFQLLAAGSKCVSTELFCHILFAMESSSSSCKTAQEDSSSTTASHTELVIGIKQSIVTVAPQVPVQETELCCNSLIVLAHCDIPVKSRAIAMETQPYSSGVVVLLHWDVPVQRAV